MNRMASGHRDGFVAGMAMGAFVGAGLALLFAPKVGTALREDIGESFTSLRDAVAERYHDLAASAGVKLDDLQERADRAADNIESGARALVDAASRQASEANARL